MAAIRALQLHPVSFTNEKGSTSLDRRLGNGTSCARLDCCYRQRKRRNFEVRVCSSNVVGSDDDKRDHRFEVSITKIGNLGSRLEDPLRRFQESISSLPPVIFVSTQLRRHEGTSISIGLSFSAAILFVAVRMYAVRRSKYERPGSVADLVRRGQLRSDRRGISSPLKYDDPFNNPLVKVSKSDSTVEMCGKVYRLAPVTLTEEQQAIHQKRRSRAYQWKRPTIFLKEGDSVPLDVDPDTIRWIPANHPFATTASEIDEDLAQNNVYQKHGVPYRIQAEHEALQKKLAMLQNEQDSSKLTDSTDAKGIKKQSKSHQKSSGDEDHGSSDSQVIYSENTKVEPAADSVEKNQVPDEMGKP